MPLYEYYCARCTAKFELLRPIARADEAATCPQGHNGGRRTLSVFAAIGKGGESSFDSMPSSGGGCACGGGGCGCGH